MLLPGPFSGKVLYGGVGADAVIFLDASKTQSGVSVASSPSMSAESG